MRVIAIGKGHDVTLQGAIEAYQRRLKKPYDVEWILLPHASQTTPQATEEESKRILQRLTDQDFLIVLDERGTMYTSPEVSRTLETAFTGSKKPVFVIGGAYGVSEALRHRADLVWSLSKLVFPHQLVRLILIEQLYRAQTIAREEPYHH